MRNIIFSEIPPDFLIQGLGLHPDDQNGSMGKIGRYEIALFSASEAQVLTDSEAQIIMIGSTAGEKFRAGDILMAGSDDLLDRTFQALDEMEQRGVVVSLIPSDDPNQICVDKEALQEKVATWKEQKLPYICLLMVEPVNNEDQAKVVTLVRKILN